MHENRMDKTPMAELERVQIRLVQEPSLYSESPINTPEAAVKLLAETFKDYDREVVAVVNLRTDLKPINVNFVSIGALNESLVHPRETLKSAILSNASSILMVHNHVSGKLEPSEEDIKITDRMSQICSLLGIGLTDHVIVGPVDEYFSFREAKRMPIPNIQYASEVDAIRMNDMKVAEPRPEKETKKTVSFTVAECSEFHDKGELHEKIPTFREAVDLFRQIPPERMHGIPSIGIRVTEVEHPEIFTEIDVLIGNKLDMDILKCVPEIGHNAQAQYAVAELLHEFHDVEVIGEIPENVQKKLQGIESREKQTEQLKNITDKLEQGVQDIFAGDDYKNLLNVMAKMPRYSLNNMLLIAMQTEGKASMCQSFTGWKSMGRFVKKGEKGIKILAPSPYTIKREQDKIDATTGKRVLDEHGNTEKELVDIRINAFKVVSTFDVSQTEGKELPSIGVNELVGNIEGYPVLLEALKQTCPVPIGFEDIQSGAKGYYHQIDKRIAIQDGMSEVQTIKTLIHEMAHQKLHAIPEEAREDIKTRSSKEVEAESIAYVVCQHYGINTSDYSFGYVAGWSDGKETTELKASLGEIREAAAEMIEAIDQAVEKELEARNNIAEPIPAETENINFDDVSNIRGISSEYSWAVAGMNEHILSCEVKGEPQTMTYTVYRHDDGEGFTIHTDKNDIWDKMSQSDMRKLEAVVSREVEYAGWKRSLEGAKTPEDVSAVKYGLMETENSTMTTEQFQSLRSEIESKEKELDHQPKKTEKKRTSVRKKLEEEKVKETKRPRKNKAKETEACV